MRIWFPASSLALALLVTICGPAQTPKGPALAADQGGSIARTAPQAAGELPDAPSAQMRAGIVNANGADTNVASTNLADIDAAAAPQSAAQQAAQTSPASSSSAPEAEPQKETRAQRQGVPTDQQQPKRILGLMPNYRAVSAGEIPLPPSSKQAFKIATENSFDYSSYVFTGLTSLLAKGTDAHPDLGKGVPGLWAYTWRGFLDKTDGNYMVIWALPTLLHEDERYYAMGHGSKWKRLGYSLAQVAVARNYQDKPTINFAEFVGRAGAQAVSTTYYPSADANFSDLSAKYAYSLLRDGATNAFREFWPDIAVHVLHRQP